MSFTDCILCKKKLTIIIIMKLGRQVKEKNPKSAHRGLIIQRCFVTQERRAGTLKAPLSYKLGIAKDRSAMVKTLVQLTLTLVAFLIIVFLIVSSKRHCTLPQETAIFLHLCPARSFVCFCSFLFLGQTTPKLCRYSLHLGSNGEHSMYRHKNEIWLVCGHVPHGPTFHNTSIPKDKCGLKQAKTHRSTEYKNTSTLM